jgi:phage antirepressor YoqD-like protein
LQEQEKAAAAKKAAEKEAAAAAAKKAAEREAAARPKVHFADIC